MKAFGIIAVVAVSSLSMACAAATGSVQLHPEEASVLHVDQLAALDVPSDSDLIGSAGTALTLVRRDRHDGRTTYVYRAAQPGNQTFVAAPREPGPDGCVSCVTVHYFAKVVQ